MGNLKKKTLRRAFRKLRLKVGYFKSLTNHRHMTKKSDNYKSDECTWRIG